MKEWKDCLSMPVGVRGLTSCAPYASDGFLPVEQGRAAQAIHGMQEFFLRRMRALVACVGPRRLLPRSTEFSTSLCGLYERSGVLWLM